MNTKSTLALVALAVVASSSFAAGEVDPSDQFPVQIQGQRTRAEVKAEAARVPTTKLSEFDQYRVLSQSKSTLDAATVRAQAIDAVRLGQTASRGEASVF